MNEMKDTIEKIRLQASRRNRTIKSLAALAITVVAGFELVNFFSSGGRAGANF